MKLKVAHNPGAYAISGVNYDESIGLNIKNFGSDIGGNWNEPDVDVTGLNSFSADLISLNDGGATGVACAVTVVADSSDTSGSSNSTANFPASSYDRGGRVGNGGQFEITFTGLPNDTPVKCKVAIFVTTSVFVTEDGDITVTDGAGTDTMAVNGTSETEYEIEAVADGSGNFAVTLDADAGATNGLGLCTVIIDYVS